RRQYEESIDFKDEYRYRSGIEATNSRFIHMTGVRRSRYRGLEKMKFGQKLKALAINVFRIAKYLQKVHKNVYVLNFKSDFFTMNEFTTKFAT
ncbi:MAG: transposase, partial [Candidatus Cloacimonetes bacterium]|nr:transposase [Candidatus Cloacimonadota bacterium]MCD4819149.1 transposase [Candidatus Cloacimonadota bacterium]